jgi:uncharacterized coiled-coil protein SlyX
MSQEDRITELEARVAWMERLISDLDGVVRDAHDRADRLEREVTELRESAQRGGQGLVAQSAPADEVPPHYGRM